MIKIEHPTRGDDTRAWGPPFAKYKDGGTYDSHVALRCDCNHKLTRVDVSLQQKEARQENLRISSA